LVILVLTIINKKEVPLEASNHDYNFSLFKPGSPYGRKNRNLIITLVTIWFVAIFGFQILLLIFQKPTPEKTLITFQSVWENVKAGNATEQQQKDYINSLVAVSGKSSVKPADKTILVNAITRAVFEMVSDSEKVILSGQVKELAEIRARLAVAPEAEYTALKSELLKIKAAINSIANEKTGIDPANNKEAILPYSLNAENKELPSEEIEALPQIMKLYLTHNQSFLTDMKILGFPFHYFYTAEFLLILFVGLCLIYSIRTTQLQKRFSIKEE
jgi:putative solute:sodium symporter small subunit